MMTGQQKLGTILCSSVSKLSDSKNTSNTTVFFKDLKETTIYYFIKQWGFLL